MSLLLHSILTSCPTSRVAIDKLTFGQGSVLFGRLRLYTKIMIKIQHNLPNKLMAGRVGEAASETKEVPIGLSQNYVTLKSAFSNSPPPPL